MNRDLEKLANQKFDLLVIGGGIHGALAAWDAVLRGLSVALIEKGDFGSATSQNSLKIIHGGLRYLQDGSLIRIRRMARERTTWMRIAPHLVHPLTCLMPTRRKLSRSRLVLGAALKMNDALSFDRNRLEDREKYIPNGRLISQKEFAELLPGYDASTSTGAAVWYDGQIFNSERLLLAFILSMVNAGGTAANYVEAIRLIKHENRIVGAQVRDVLSGKIFDIQSRLTLNCTGAWVDALLKDVSTSSGYAGSVAINITVDKIWADAAVGLSSQPTQDRKSQILFFVPWRRKTMIGTWHIPWNGIPDQFRITESILQDFLNEINSANPASKLTLEDIQHVTWGFLPVNREDANSEKVKLTRDGIVIDHHKRDDLDGLITVLGVKYTTARVVAEGAIDLAVQKLGVKAGRCQTHIKRVDSGQINDFNAFLSQTQADWSSLLDADILEHLVYTYGSDVQDLLQSIRQQPELGMRLDLLSPITIAEVLRAIQHEMAVTLNDVIQRRTELGASGLPAINILERCAAWMGRELGWNSERQNREIESVIQAYSLKRIERVTA